MTYEELRQAQADEYGEYVAVEPITVGGALAFNPGDPVPKGHVASGVVAKTSVERRRDSAKAPADAKTKSTTTEGTV
jgi:hypothetical protein